MEQNEEQTRIGAPKRDVVNASSRISWYKRHKTLFALATAGLCPAGEMACVIKDSTVICGTCCNIRQSRWLLVCCCFKLTLFFFFISLCLRWCGLWQPPPLFPQTACFYTITTTLLPFVLLRLFVLIWMHRHFPRRLSGLWIKENQRLKAHAWVSAGRATLQRVAVVCSMRIPAAPNSK